MQQIITLTSEQLNMVVANQLEIKLAELGIVPAMITRAQAIRITGSERLIDYLIHNNLLIPIQDPNSVTKRYSRKRLLELLHTNQKAQRIVRKKITSKQNCNGK